MTPLSLRSISLALYEYRQAHGGNDPGRITMAPATRDALYREMFGDAEGEDMRAALAMEVQVDDTLSPDEFRLA